MKRQVNSSSNLASFFTVMIHNSSVSFMLIHFLLWIKRSNQSSNFETFECSGKNLPNFSCHFPNHKSVFLSTKGAYQSLNLVKFHVSNRKYEICTLMALFCPNHMKFQLKKYGRVISHDTEE